MYSGTVKEWNPVRELRDGSAKVHIRWLIRRDMPEVMAIEREAFEFPWFEEEFVRCLRQRNCISMVAEIQERVVAFIVYELHKTRLHKTRLHILNLAVIPDMRHKGVGSQVIAKIIGKLNGHRRNVITLEVRATNLAAQVFFRSCGFKAVNVLEDFYNGSPEEAYSFRYVLPRDYPAMVTVEKRSVR